MAGAKGEGGRRLQCKADRNGTVGSRRGRRMEGGSRSQRRRNFYLGTAPCGEPVVVWALLKREKEEEEAKASDCRGGAQRVVGKAGELKAWPRTTFLRQSVQEGTWGR